MKITLRNTSIGLAAFANSSVEAPPEVAPSLVDAVSDPGYGAAAGSPSAPPNPEISKKPKPKKRPRCSVAVEPVSPPTYAKAKLEVKSEAHAPSHGACAFAYVRFSLYYHNRDCPAPVSVHMYDLHLAILYF
jgi:hypothetical protein